MSAFYTFEDLSGSSDPKLSANPYENLLNACQNDTTQIQARYNTHRTNRNVQQRNKILAADFAGAAIDEILAKLENPTIDPGFTDWRNCLVFWARPTNHVKLLIAKIQQKLLKVIPNLWVMPNSSLHMTALEITHSLTVEQIGALVNQMLPNVEEITNFTLDHRARLVKPLLSYDAQALALSFLPANGEIGRSREEDAYTYHHLRRDLFEKASATGVTVVSRYVIPSAHLTIGRFIIKQDLEDESGAVDREKVRALVATIDEINQWLEEEYWPEDGAIKAGGEWVVGEEKGLEFRRGTLWYGSGGEMVHAGKGF